MTRLNWRLIASAAVVVTLSACGGGGSSSTSPSPSPSPSPILGTATKMVAGTSKSVLVDLDGKTLYFLSSESTSSLLCTGACASNWPPLIVTGNPVAPSGVSGTLSTVDGANGHQVTYNGHPLYRFKNDLTTSDVKGEGINAKGGTWHAATPSTPA